jgi:hypothetical protein
MRTYRASFLASYRGTGARLIYVLACCNDAQCSAHFCLAVGAFPWRHMGRHHDRARTPDIDRAWRAGRVRARVNRRPHRRRTGTRQGARRQNGPKTETDRTPKSARQFAAATKTANQCARLPAATMLATARFQGCRIKGALPHGRYYHARAAIG